MTVNTMTPTKKAGGCGCGGSGGTTAVSSCTCGNAMCVTCLDQGYTRPRFFAGQLLTEEDLQLLGDYVIAKNRLHNRYLMGSGVVCGLQVTCHPCEYGHVVVNPGYAIDCCGNDIVISCPQELDINKMVHDLQIKLRGGYDCGDPCAKTGSYSAGSSMTEAGNNGNGSKSAAEVSPKFHRHKYCLYVNYCEQDTEPVAPYATDEPCGPTICEPSRVREGFCFELRCPEEDEAPPPLCARLWDCYGDTTSLERTVSDAEHLQPKAAKFLAVAEELKKNQTPEIGTLETYAKVLTDRTTSLEQLLGKASESLKTVTQVTLQPVLERTVALASSVALLRVQDTKTQRTFHENLAKQIKDAQAQLAAAQAEISRHLSKASLTTLESAYDSAVLDMVSKLFPSQQQQQAKAEEVGELFKQNKEISVLVLAYGVVLREALYNLYAESLDAMQYWLQKQTRHPQSSTHCDLQAKVATTPVPTPVVDDLRLNHVSMLGNSSLIFTQSVNTVLCSCICDALNPPCPPCDDTGVLLACLTVEDCRVKDICNLERDFVLSPVAIRYWFPQIELLGEAIEKWCCPCPEDKGDSADQGTTLLSNRREMLSCRELYYIMERYFCPRPDKDVAFPPVKKLNLRGTPTSIAAGLQDFAVTGAMAWRSEVDEIKSRLDNLSSELQELLRARTRRRH